MCKVWKDINNQASLDYLLTGNCAGRMESRIPGSDSLTRSLRKLEEHSINGSVANLLIQKRSFSSARRKQCTQKNSSTCIAIIILVALEG